MAGAIYRTHLMGSKKPSPPDPEVGVSLYPLGELTRTPASGRLLPYGEDIDVTTRRSPLDRWAGFTSLLLVAVHFLDGS